MNLPDLEVDRVKSSFYSDTLECDCPWAAVHGVSFKKKKEMLTLDESYEKRIHDYGFIRVSFYLRQCGGI